MSREPSGRNRWTDERPGNWLSHRQPDGGTWRTFIGRFGDEDAWPDGGRSTADTESNRPAEPTVLVESDGDELVRVASLALLDEQFTPGDGVVYVGTRDDLPGLVGQISGSVRGLSPAEIGVVDQRSTTIDEEAVSGPVRTVLPESDAESLIASVEECFRAINDVVDGRIHLFVDDVRSSGTEPADSVYDRMYELAMGVGTEPGLALFGLNRGSVCDGLCERLPHLFDVHVTLRDSRGEPEARWTALTGASDGWQAVRDLSFGVPAFA